MAIDGRDESLQFDGSSSVILQLKVKIQVGGR